MQLIAKYSANDRLYLRQLMVGRVAVDMCGFYVCMWVHHKQQQTMSRQTMAQNTALATATTLATTTETGTTTKPDAETITKTTTLFYNNNISYNNNKNQRQHCKKQLSQWGQICPPGRLWPGCLFAYLPFIQLVPKPAHISTGTSV